MNGALAWPSKAGITEKETGLLAQVKTNIKGKLQLYASKTMNRNKYWEPPAFYYVPLVI